MAKQLYAFEIEPGDREHLPAYYFTEGVVEAEPEEMKALLDSLADRHPDLVTVRPVEDAAVDFERFRVNVGSGLLAYHDEVHPGPPCEEERDLVRASVAADYGLERVDEVVERAYARPSSDPDYSAFYEDDEEE
jgi:hypothetical protein